MKVIHLAPGDSEEQRAREPVMLRLLSKKLGQPLKKERITLRNGSCVQVDGCNKDRTLLCETWAHQGRPKSAQKMKVITDAAKLFTAAEALGGSVRKIIAFADAEAASWFLGGSWMGDALRGMGVEIVVLKLPHDVVAGIRAAQLRQYR